MFKMFYTLASHRQQAAPIIYWASLDHLHGYSYTIILMIQTTTKFSRPVWNISFKHTAAQTQLNISKFSIRDVTPYQRAKSLMPNTKKWAAVANSKKRHNLYLFLVSTNIKTGENTFPILHRSATKNRLCAIHLLHSYGVRIWSKK